MRLSNPGGAKMSRERDHPLTGGNFMIEVLEALDSHASQLSPPGGLTQNQVVEHAEFGIG